MTIALILSVALALLTPSVAATTCVSHGQPGALDAALPISDPDQELFNLAVVEQINFYRCLEGLAPVESEIGLVSVAASHAGWMAAQSRLSHKSDLPDLSTVRQRIGLAVAGASFGSENIGLVHRFRVDEGPAFYAGRGLCEFVTNAGRPIDRHSYLSMAERIVSLWIQSPDHRANILDKNAKLTGNALAFDPTAQHCGVFYMAQNFAG